MKPRCTCSPLETSAGFNNFLALTDNSEILDISPPGDCPSLPEQSVTARQAGAVRKPRAPSRLYDQAPASWKILLEFIYIITLGRQ